MSHGRDSVQGVTLESATLRPSALTREALAASGGAAVLAALLVWTVPPGADFAAHVYQRAVFLQHGFALWNNFWYAGRYSFITYSLLYYPLAAAIGIKLLAVATIAAAALAFAVVVLRQWGTEARWSSRTFAVVWAGVVLTAAFPFALGTALALLAIWALQGERLWRFSLLALLTVAASPLAFLLLALVLLGIAIGRRTDRRLRSAQASRSCRSGSSRSLSGACSRTTGATRSRSGSCSARSSSAATASS